MINLYAYSYPAAMREFADEGYTLIKLGDSHRDTDVRIAEQGGAAEWQGKVKIAEWVGLKKIERDFVIHRILTERGLWHKEDNAGTEWFKIPAKNAAEVYRYIDKIVTDLEGKRVRKPVKLRPLQQRQLDKALELIDNGKASAELIANLCPRFGKTVWAIKLFDEISKKYGNRVMLVPAYWLSVHTSFIDELDKYTDFSDIRVVDPSEPEAYLSAWDYIQRGERILIPVSLHGNLTEWCNKHYWISTIPNNEIYVFADEGDFGTHTDNQQAKLEFLFKE